MFVSPDTVRKVLSTIAQQNFQPFDFDGNIITDFDKFILSEPEFILISQKVETKHFFGLFKTTSYKRIAGLELPKEVNRPWLFYYGQKLTRTEKLLAFSLIKVLETLCEIPIRYG